jgi:hypothetical protein
MLGTYASARLADLGGRLQALVRAIRADDEGAIDAVLRVSRSRRLFAPLAFLVGAFAMLFDGLRIVLTNWRLTLVQVLPAMWIWLAMYDLKARVLHGKSLHALRGPVLIPINLAVIALTIGAYLLNAVFAYAISAPAPHPVRPAFAAARRRITPILVAGCVVGAMLGVAITIAPRWDNPWFALALGVVVAVMMITYVAVPARLIGIKPEQSKRDKLAVSAIGAAIGTTVCTPPYLLGRLGILMLGSKALLIPGIFVFALGATLQVGATGAVRAIKMSARLISEPGDDAAHQAHLTTAPRGAPEDHSPTGRAL